MRSEVERIGRILNERSQPLKARFRALFTLRNMGGPDSIKEISRCFQDDSALLKHELAFCLGQMGDPDAIPKLTQVLENLEEHPMVRHEADPTPPAADRSVEELGGVLTDVSLPLWERYRAMFALRNNGSKEAVHALARGLSCPDSALFRHEVAYVLGQIQSEACVKELEASLADREENCMVRHECAEALGAIGTPEADKILHHFLKDEEAVVRESCEVALDMSDYENSLEFQYANSLSV